MIPARPGEAALIARYFAPLAGEGADGLRDDAAVLVPRPGHDLVLTTDAVVAGVHFFPDDPAPGVALKALATNLSDLAAKGAAPRGFLLTLALPDDWTQAWLAGFSEGLGEASRRLDCPLLGGDTVRANGALLVGITAFGEVPAGTMVPRRGARAGDRLCVTGTIGDAALGLRLRRADHPGLAGLDPGARAFLLDRYHHPQARNALAEGLRRHARAAMDVSDGLAGDLAKMLDAGLTARVRIADVPLSRAARAAVAIDPGLWPSVLAGGDDYEILCAVPPDALDALQNGAGRAGVPLAVIGCVEAGPGPPAFVDAAGHALPLAAPAFDHF